ncbi:MAG: GNAT family N-acetyltransferase [Treponema sp.]|nr:GNAT family N-acetyltransferase [Treponema sp.]
MYLKYTLYGYIYISPDDDCRAIADAMIETGYDLDFCLAENFEPDFMAKLMEAGFLVMSMNLSEDVSKPYYILLPKLHLVRSALFFENLHIKKSIKRMLGRYELKADVDFDYILDRCIEKHGADWLTPPLVESIKKIRRNIMDRESSSNNALQSLTPNSSFAYPASFALYRDGKLAAGEFGVVCGKVYTSYSGFYEEDNAGTVQIILTARYLQEHGFSFFDMGMPLDYKTSLGSVDISPEEFVSLFKASCSS